MSKKAKEILDKWHSRMVRVRDALRTTGTPDRLKCITCPAVLPVESAVACHYQKRGNLIYRWDDHNVHGGCTFCNAFHNTPEGEEYLRIMLLDLYGEEEVARLDSGYKKLVKFYDFELLSQAQECMEFVLERAPGLYPSQKIL